MLMSPMTKILIDCKIDKELTIMIRSCTRGHKVFLIHQTLDFQEYILNKQLKFCPPTEIHKYKFTFMRF